MNIKTCLKDQNTLISQVIVCLILHYTAIWLVYLKLSFMGVILPKRSDYGCSVHAGIQKGLSHVYFILSLTHTQSSVSQHIIAIDNTALNDRTGPHCIDIVSIYVVLSRPGQHVLAKHNIMNTHCIKTTHSLTWKQWNQKTY